MPVSISAKPGRKAPLVDKVNKPTGRVSITEGIDARKFPFNPANPPPHPNTAEPRLTQSQATDAMRDVKMTVPSREQLNRDHTIAMIAAKLAWTKGRPFSGQLLEHFLSATGRQVVVPLRRAGGVLDRRFLSESTLPEAEGQLLSAVR